MSAKANDPNYIMAVRAEVPAPSMDDEDRNEWDRILNRRHPYNATTRDGDDRTRISGIVGAPAGDDPGVLYSVHYVEEGRSEEHTSELQSLMRISYAVFCLKKKKTRINTREMNESKRKILKYTTIYTQ